jgi:hypothetical protein
MGLRRSRCRNERFSSKVEETEGLRRGVLLYGAQENPQVDTKIAENRRFWTGARMIHEESTARRDALRVATSSRNGRSMYRKYAFAPISCDNVAALAPPAFRDETS